MKNLKNHPREITVFRGAGDLASGIALRLWRSGYKVILTELARPLCIRRTVAFANAVYEGKMNVEDAECVLAKTIEQAQDLWQDGKIPLLIDPELNQIRSMTPEVLVDARIMKSFRGDTNLSDAPLVIGLGPGFIAGKNAHAVIETNRGHNLGRVFWQGSAEPDTGTPGLIGGEGPKRVQKAPVGGVFVPQTSIGDTVAEGDLLALIDSTELRSPLSGIVRGSIYPGTVVTKGLKIMDIDPRGNKANCYTVSDKASSLGGAVLEAILTWNVRESAQRQY